MTSMKERYQATLMGCAIGDTLGMPVEGWKREQIKKYLGKIREPLAPVRIRDEKGRIVKKDEFGRVKGYGKDLKRGEYTDDTILTIAIAESIAEKKELDLEDIARRQVEAYKPFVKKNGHVRGGFGRTTKDAFKKMISGASVYESGMAPGLGNGPCMKISPVGMWMHATGIYDAGINAARLIGLNTHLDERAVASGIVQADAIFTLLSLEKITRLEFLSYLIDCSIKNERNLAENAVLSEKGNLTERLKWIKENRNASCEEAFKKLGNSSLAFESYPFAVFMFQKYWNKPLKGLIETVNYGGDCDTTCAIYGALAGAKNGMIFPKKWVKVLANSKYIKELGSKIYKLRKFK